MKSVLLSSGLSREEDVSVFETFVRKKSQSDLRLHFGLGKSSRAAKIVIRWPSGLVETLSAFPRISIT
jgi:hypothetical protein